MIGVSADTNRQVCVWRTLEIAVTTKAFMFFSETRCWCARFIKEP
jgi:hypothetical protein